MHTNLMTSHMYVFYSSSDHPVSITRIIWKREGKTQDEDGEKEDFSYFNSYTCEIHLKGLMSWPASVYCQVCNKSTGNCNEVCQTGGVNAWSYFSNNNYHRSPFSLIEANNSWKIWKIWCSNKAKTNTLQPH